MSHISLGWNSASAPIFVGDTIPCVIPAKPSITVTGLWTANPVLESSSEISNRWYIDGERIPEGDDRQFYPSWSGTYTVQVVVFEGCQSPMSEPVSIVVKPIIFDFTPESGFIGSTVTINGQNFDPVPQNNVVFFGACRAIVSDGSPYHLTVTVPPGAVYQPITVVSKGLFANSTKPFLVTFDGTPGISDSTFIHKKVIGEAIAMTGGDLDGDHKVDFVVIGGQGSSVSVFRNTSIGAGSISFSSKIDIETTLVNAKVPLVSDLDGDGKLDVVVVSAFGSNQVSVFRNTSQGEGDVRFDSPIHFSTGSDPRSGLVGDIDRDGRPDIVVANTNSNSLSILLNKGIGIGHVDFAGKIDLATGRGPHYVSIADLDGDYRDDLLFRNGVDTLSIFHNTRESIVGKAISFPQKQDYAAGQLIRALCIAEIDSDGKPDVVIANEVSNTISVLRNVTTPPSSSPGNYAIDFEDRLDFPTSGRPMALSAADFDGNGKVDLAIGTGTLGVSLRSNTSSPANISFATSVNLATSSVVTGIYLCDLDADGKSDMAIVDGSTLSIFRNITPLSAGPNIISFTPPGGSVGTAVTITGNNFDPILGNNNVTFNGISAIVTTASPSTITALVPDAASSGPIAVKVGGITAVSAHDFIACTKPATPAITVIVQGNEETVLTSSSDDGNQWFLDEMPLAGETGSTITVSTPGTYTVRVTVAGGCASEFSNGFVFTVTSIAPEMGFKIGIYPNPTSGRITVELPNTAKYILSLYNSAGALVQATIFEGKTFAIDLTQYPTGIYFFQARNMNMRVIWRIMKQ